MFNKKYKNKIKELEKIIEKIIEEKNEIIRQKETSNCFLRDELSVVGRKIAKLEKQKNYKEFQYAILVDNNDGYNPVAKFWNNGKLEENVRELHYDHIAGELPKITIIK